MLSLIKQLRGITALFLIGFLGLAALTLFRGTIIARWLWALVGVVAVVGAVNTVSYD